MENNTASNEFGFFQLPNEILEKVFSYLTYDEVSLCRSTCQALNTLASSCLNKGFARADRLHATIQREIKAKLPRRESERRNHPLARHVDILSAVETRLSLLCMTYSKYIDVGLCCFIPGKVLDEIYRVLRSVRVDPNPPRAHELLQELRDISSMAMEHFDEKIVPCIKARLPTSELRLVLSSTSKPSSSAAPGPSLFKFRVGQSCQPLAPVSSGSGRRRHSRSSNELRKQLRHTRAELRQRQATADTKLAELSRKIAEQDRTIAELNRRVVDYDQRFDDIMAEFARIRATDEDSAPPVVCRTKSGCNKDMMVPLNSDTSATTSALSSSASLPTKRTASFSSSSSSRRLVVKFSSCPSEKACQLKASTSTSINPLSCLGTDVEHAGCGSSNKKAAQSDGDQNEHHRNQGARKGEKRSRCTGTETYAVLQKKLCTWKDDELSVVVPKASSYRSLRSGLKYLS